jgi:hypothetical protein
MQGSIIEHSSKMGEIVQTKDANPCKEWPQAGRLALDLPSSPALP